MEIAIKLKMHRKTKAPSWKAFLEDWQVRNAAKVSKHFFFWVALALGSFTQHAVENVSK